MRKLPVVALALFSISLFAQDDAMTPPDAKQQAAAKAFTAKRPAVQAWSPIVAAVPLVPFN